MDCLLDQARRASNNRVAHRASAVQLDNHTAAPIEVPAPAQQGLPNRLHISSS